MKFNKERFEHLISDCSKWSKDRNIIEGTTALDQAVMLLEELGELATGIRKQDRAMIKDAIGDIIVVLNGMCLQLLKVDLKQFSKYIYNTQNESDIKENLAVLSKSICNLASSCTGVVANEMIKQRVQNILHDLNYICQNSGMAIEEALESAYNEIKDRKGIVFNGTFIKESDPNYTTICRLVSGQGTLSANGNIIK